MVSGYASGETKPVSTKKFPPLTCPTPPPPPPSYQYPQTFSRMFWSCRIRTGIEIPSFNSLSFIQNPLWDKTRSFWDIKNSLSHEWAVRANERTDERVAQYLRLDSCLFQTTVESFIFSHYSHSHKSKKRNRDVVISIHTKRKGPI